MNNDFIHTLLISGKLATYTTLILLVAGFPIAYLLAYKRFWYKPFIEALISMPMVLPPTVLGFYLLIAYSPQNAFGRFLEQYFNVRLAFSFEGVLLASVICSVPYMIQPLQNGLMAIPASLREASYILGKSRIETFFRVLIPNMIPGIITGIAMTFAHCIGEFGVVLMVGGNIQGETRLASIAIYDEVQGMNYAIANQYSLTLFIISILLLTIIFSINRMKKSQLQSQYF